MPGNDWLVGGDRRAIAAGRIYDVAAALIARNGLDAFDIDTLAGQVPCSRATVYRYVGGKTQIGDAVLARASARIIDTVRAAVENLSGPERVVTAITVTLSLIRSDPLGQLMINSTRRADQITWLSASPMVASIAGDLAGLTQRGPQAAQLLVRLVLSLLCWPMGDVDTEQQALEQFVALAFAERRDAKPA